MLISPVLSVHTQQAKAAFSFPVPLLFVSFCIPPLSASTAAVVLSDIKPRCRMEGTEGLMQEGYWSPGVPRGVSGNLTFTIHCLSGYKRIPALGHCLCHPGLPGGKIPLKFAQCLDKRQHRGASSNTRGFYCTSPYASAVLIMVSRDTAASGEHSPQKAPQLW